MLTKQAVDKEEVDVNLAETSAADFAKYYNDNVPDSFPRATLKTLDEFQTQYPSLFKEGGEWIINKHRKKFMDWLASHR